MRAVLKISPIFPARNRFRPDTEPAVHVKKRKADGETFERILLQEEMRGSV